MLITGPGQVYGGINPNTGANTTISYGSLQFEKRGTTRYEQSKIWDLGVHKTFTFRGGQQRVKVMLDGFNILNDDLILNYSSSNVSIAGTTANPVKPSDRISRILPPRIFRLGATFSF